MYSSFKYKVLNKVPHVLLIGAVSEVTARNFFTEFFHTDHGTDQTRHCVILKNQRPDNKMANLLNQNQYISTVYYLEGNPHNPARLRHA